MIHKARIDHLLRKRNERESVVSYSELLFDLIYVFAVTQLSHFLLHHLNLLGIVQSVVLWFGVWMIWQHTIWVTNWFNPYKRSIRLFLFVIMIGSLVMTSALPGAFGSRAPVFVLTYVSIQIGRTLFVLFLLGGDHALSNNYKRLLTWMCISSLFWVLGLFGEGYLRVCLWALAVLIDYTAPMFGFYLPGLGRSVSHRDWTVDGDLMLERCKLFVMIAFGETILMTGSSLSDIGHWSPEIVAAALVSFLGSLAMWWVYFDVSSEAASRKIHGTNDPGRLGLEYNAVHVVLVGALIVCAVGNELVVSDPDGRINAVSLYVLIYGPMIYLLANLAFKWLTCGIIARSHLVAIGMLAVLIPVSFLTDILIVNTAVLLIFVYVAAAEYLMARNTGTGEEDVGL